MVVTETFRSDHEEGDSPRDTQSLRIFKAMGIDLGALVTLWECRACNYAIATFAYDEEPD
jgi:hypothetical protein